MKSGFRAALVAGAAALSGCWYPGPADTERPPARQRAFSIVSTSLWPNSALGPGATFEVVVNGEGVVSAQLGPREVQRYVTAENPRAVFRAEEFPEALGSVLLSIEGTAEVQRVEDVQFDFTPPQLTKVASTRIAAGDLLHLEVWDAVMVRYAQVMFGGLPLRVELNQRPMERALPVDFEVSMLPEGRSDLTIWVEDMAGNRLLASVPSLLIDRTPPRVSFVQPMEGSRVSGRFVVQVRAHDNLGPTSVELRASGSHLASLGAPDASATIDAAMLPLGPLELEAVAIDEAGNESPPTRITVEVQ